MSSAFELRRRAAQRKEAESSVPMPQAFSRDDRLCRWAAILQGTHCMLEARLVDRRERSEAVEVLVYRSDLQRSMEVTITRADAVQVLSVEHGSDAALLRFPFNLASLRTIARYVGDHFARYRQGASQLTPSRVFLAPFQLVFRSWGGKMRVLLSKPHPAGDVTFTASIHLPTGAWAIARCRERHRGRQLGPRAPGTAEGTWSVQIELHYLRDDRDPTTLQVDDLSLRLAVGESLGRRHRFAVRGVPETDAHDESDLIEELRRSGDWTGVRRVLTTEVLVVDGAVVSAIARRRVEAAVAVQRHARRAAACRIGRAELQQQALVRYSKAYDRVRFSYYWYDVLYGTRYNSKPKTLGDLDVEAPDTWEEFYDESSGCTYYFNASRGVTSKYNEEHAVELLQRCIRRHQGRFTSLKLADVVFALRLVTTAVERYALNPSDAVTALHHTLYYQTVVLDWDKAAALYKQLPLVHPLVLWCWAVFTLAHDVGPREILWRDALVALKHARKGDPKLEGFDHLDKGFFKYGLQAHRGRLRPLLQYALVAQCVLRNYSLAGRLYERCMSYSDDPDFCSVLDNYADFLRERHVGGMYAGEGPTALQISRAVPFESHPSEAGEVFGSTRHLLRHDGDEWQAMQDPVAKNFLRALFYKHTATGVCLWVLPDENLPAKLAAVLELRWQLRSRPETS